MTKKAFVKSAYDALDNVLVRHVTPMLCGFRDATRRADDEAHRDFPLQIIVSS